jgi:hypothetical protein
MASTREFRREVCGLVAVSPSRWFIIRCVDSQLTVHRWDFEGAQVAGARHYCGEAHAEVYMSRGGSSQFVPRRNQALLANCQVESTGD